MSSYFMKHKSYFLYLICFLLYIQIDTLNLKVIKLNDKLKEINLGHKKSLDDLRFFLNKLYEKEKFASNNSFKILSIAYKGKLNFEKSMVFQPSEQENITFEVDFQNDYEVLQLNFAELLDNFLPNSTLVQTQVIWCSQFDSSQIMQGSNLVQFYLHDDGSFNNSKQLDTNNANQQTLHTIQNERECKIQNDIISLSEEGILYIDSHGVYDEDEEERNQWKSKGNQDDHTHITFIVKGQQRNQQNLIQHPDDTFIKQ